jgi:hypothetical protein
MEIRRYLETLLIWMRAKKDNLIYTITIVMGMIGLLFMIYGNYRLGLTIAFFSILVMALAIVWTTD